MDNQENVYFKDAKVFIQQVAKELSEDISCEGVLNSTMNFALGMERVLKGILFSLNPVYVYKAQVFKNTVSLLYKDSLLENAKHNQEIAKEPNADVLTFKLSLLRASSISRATEKNKNLLFTLSNLRDIIAHQPLSLINIKSTKMLLLREFYPLICDYSDELGISISSFVGSYDIKLASLSSGFQEDIEDKIRIKLLSHQKRWEQLENVPGYVEKMKKKTRVYGQRDDVIIVDCPACGNDSMLRFETEYDDIEYYGSQVVGIFVSDLRCFFCKLGIVDYDEIDFLNLDDFLVEDLSMDDNLLSLPADELY